MSTSHVAYSIYPETYTTSIDQKNLEMTGKSGFHTHISTHAEKLHLVSEIILLPGRWTAQLFAGAVQPLPGKSKNNYLLEIAARTTSLFLLICVIPLAIPSCVLGLALRWIDHKFRPAMSYINNSASTNAKIKTGPDLILNPNNPLHIRSHNIGMVTSSMSIAGDLRAPTQRAKELVDAIASDSSKPDIIFFQEAFHEDATKILCEGLKEEYPYIIHSVAPQLSGFNSGAMVASKYPIQHTEFHRLQGMIGPERAAPRGVIKVRLESATHGPILLYGAHTQALIGEDRAQARYDQLQQIRCLMEQDAQNTKGIMQVLMGDFNTSRVTVWGDDNLQPKEQAEEKVLSRLHTYFDDIYLRDHDAVTGQRTSGHPTYLEKDNALMNENLVEPSGSWYHGPFATPGMLLSAAMRKDRKKHRRPDPKKVTEILMKPTRWGTPSWHSDQTANTARFDYILLPQTQRDPALKNRLDGRAEIRRTFVPVGAQSASSDHLPVDGQIWVTNGSHTQ